MTVNGHCKRCNQIQEDNFDLLLWKHCIIDGTLILYQLAVFQIHWCASMTEHADAFLVIFFLINGISMSGFYVLLNTADPFNISPTLLTPTQPLPPTPLSHPQPLCLSLSVSDRVCYMSRLPACSVPNSLSSGDVVSSALSPGNRRVRSPPRGGGAGVGREGEEQEGTSGFFPPFIPKSESSKNLCTYAHT